MESSKSVARDVSGILPHSGGVPEGLLIPDLLQEVSSKDCIMFPVGKQHCDASSFLFVSLFPIISWRLAGWEREDTG